VVGFVETDGTLGTLVTGNITDWRLTLTAPNLLGGPISVIDFAARIQSSVMGNALIATTTQLLFDFDSPGINFFLLQGKLPNGNYWCVETAWCVANARAESIGRVEGGGPIAQTIARTGLVAMATTIPEPGTFILLAFGLTGLAFARRHW
jgi:hypothetical protein